MRHTATSVLFAAAIMTLSACGPTPTEGDPTVADELEMRVARSDSLLMFRNCTCGEGSPYEGYLGYEEWPGFTECVRKNDENRIALQNALAERRPVQVGFSDAGAAPGGVAYFWFVDAYGASGVSGTHYSETFCDTTSCPDAGWNAESFDELSLTETTRSYEGCEGEDDEFTAIEVTWAPDETMTFPRGYNLR